MKDFPMVAVNYQAYRFLKAVMVNPARLNVDRTYFASSHGEICDVP